ncbi:MAG: hypothetical protein JWR19_1240 [Pedosphaera sp.]|nr:hypothetical protein [Pedosphaera sp.]
MKYFAMLAMILVTASSAPAAPPTLEELSAQVFINATIVWQAPTNHLPTSFWVYQRALPHVFSPTVISNAIVLGSLQSKGFPPPSTNNFYIWEDKGPHYPGPIPSIFGIIPGDANIYYSMPNYAMGSEKDIPTDETIVKQAWKYAAQLGLDPAKLVQKKIYTHWCDADQNGHATNACGRGVFLARQLDGIAFFSFNDEGEGAEGFSIELGSHGQIRSFSLRWSKVEHYISQPIASPQEIIQCIKAHKIIVPPNVEEEDYFSKLKKLASVKKLTITKITPYYGEGVFGEVPTNDVPCKFATPFAELEAVADFGSSNGVVRFVSPIISSEVTRLLGNKTK